MQGMTVKSEGMRALEPVSRCGDYIKIIPGKASQHKYIFLCWRGTAQVVAISGLSLFHGVNKIIQGQKIAFIS